MLSFRSGAIEQLMTHSKALDFKLHAGVYGDNPIKIAKRAIVQSSRDQDDILIIDTAGRMVGNDSLMRSIAHLIHEIQADRVYFVGEALTGTDGVAQLRGFNDYILRANATESKTSGIDAIILTKMDTVDHRTGAIINLTFETGIPIEFIGTGQTYQDLIPFNFPLYIRKLVK
jgi:signal recognition particle receptor subunit alpha